MKLCFVSVNGPRETYFVDAPRITIKNQLYKHFTASMDTLHSESCTKGHNKDIVKLVIKYVKQVGRCCGYGIVIYKSLQET
jgi:hypothetical protein